MRIKHRTLVFPHRSFIGADPPEPNHRALIPERPAGTKPSKATALRLTQPLHPHLVLALRNVKVAHLRQMDASRTDHHLFLIDYPHWVPLPR